MAAAGTLAGIVSSAFAAAPRIVAGTQANPPWSWDLVQDLREMWSYPFMVNAFRAATIVAIVAGTVGWFMVLRRQTFAGHTVAVAAFPGATAATLLGISAVIGYFTFALGAAIVIALAASPGAPHGAAHGHARRARRAGLTEESAVVGMVQAFVLACGFLFAHLYPGFLGSVNAPLFGSSFAITDTQVVTLGLAGVVVLAVLAIVGRPLLFSSVDADVAAARGVAVRKLGVVFLLLLGAAAAEASQISGALLVFALLVMPAATAQRLTARPGLSVALTIAFGLVAAWGGLFLAYYQPYPLGFCVSSFAFGCYLAARLVTAPAWRRDIGPARAPQPIEAAS